RKKHNRRRTTKSFVANAHTNLRVCPVDTFLAFRPRQLYYSIFTLFVNSVRPNDPLSIRILYSWIKKLIRLSSEELRLSFQSIISSLALPYGTPKENIVTMGNWASFKSFEHHIRQEHLGQFDFTNTLVCPSDDLNISGFKEDIFFDALDTL
ncbi:hypothetical protein BD560DRAFT_461147, partial [Blakeslea trispora]